MRNQQLCCLCHYFRVRASIKPHSMLHNYPSYLATSTTLICKNRIEFAIKKYLPNYVDEMYRSQAKPNFGYPFLISSEKKYFRR